MDTTEQQMPEAINEEHSPDTAKPKTGSKNTAAKGGAGVASITRKLELKTWTAQRVYDKAFERYKGDTFVLTTRLRDLGQDKAADAAEALIRGELDKIQKDLSNELQQADVLLDTLGIDELPDYDGVQTVTAKITSQLAGRMLDLLLLLDKLVQRLDVLSLTGQIEQRQRDMRCRQWKQRMLRMGGRVRNKADQTRGMLRHREGHNETAERLGSVIEGDRDKTRKSDATEDAELIDIGAASETPAVESAAEEP